MDQAAGQQGTKSENLAMANIFECTDYNRNQCLFPIPGRVLSFPKALCKIAEHGIVIDAGSKMLKQPCREFRWLTWCHAFFPSSLGIPAHSLVNVC